MRRTAHLSAIRRSLTLHNNALYPRNSRPGKNFSREEFSANELSQAVIYSQNLLINPLDQTQIFHCINYLSINMSYISPACL